MNYCGWIICEQNSHYEVDFPTGDAYCRRITGMCEAGKHPVKVVEGLVKGRKEDKP